VRGRNLDETSGCRGRDPGEVALREVVGGEGFWIVEDRWQEVGGEVFLRLRRGGRRIRRPSRLRQGRTSSSGESSVKIRIQRWWSVRWSWGSGGF
jgi:hypothetical protein